MNVSLGINPITWTNDDMPELGGDIPLETFLAETRLAEFAGIGVGSGREMVARRAGMA